MKNKYLTHRLYTEILSEKGINTYSGKPKKPHNVGKTKFNEDMKRLLHVKEGNEIS